MLQRAKKNEAITLITLVITIVIIILLTGIVINIALGENGLLKRAKVAKLTMKESTVKETIGAIVLDMQMEGVAKRENLDLKQITEKLESKDKNIQLEEYKEEDEIIKGTYNIKGEGYKFIINEKLEVEIVGKKVTPTIIISVPNNESEVRKENELPFTWAQLSEISGIIENTLKDNNPNNDITNDTNEFTLEYKGKEYTIGVGDYKKVKYNENDLKVRIIGFNHDILAGQAILNEDGTLKAEYRDTTNNNNQISEEGFTKLNKAGISFEFVDCLIKDVNMYEVNSKNISNAGGWENREIRKQLNGQDNEENKVPGIIDSLPDIKLYIKKVTKAYGATYNSTYLSYTDDKIWLLSCTEVHGESGYRGPFGGVCMSGHSACLDGIQYKLYKNTKKPYNSPNIDVAKGVNWWLRSTINDQPTYFSGIGIDGSWLFYTVAEMMNVAPGFAI